MILRLDSARRSLKAAGFSLAELLIVISIIVVILSVGVVSLQSLTSHSTMQLGQQSVVSALRLARQHAISNRTCCMTEIVAINDNPRARPTAPGTPYVTAQDGESDRVRIFAFKKVRSADTGATAHVLDTSVLKEFILPDTLVFDDERGARRWYPENADVSADADMDGAADGRPLSKIFFVFEPDGGCTSQSSRAGNVLRLRDLNTGQTSTIAVQPNTGYIAARQY